MSDERGLKSLRAGAKRKTVRPTISNPRPVNEPNKNVDVPRGRDGPPDGPPAARQRPPLASGKTSDLVKRRFSTRFNDLPTDGFAPPMPALPSFDSYEAASSRDREMRGAPPSRGASAPLTIDRRVLGDPNLSAEQYVAKILSDATEDEIREFEESLRGLKDGTSQRLQANVLQNRTQFIKISKEAEKLKGEMRALKNLMSELKANTTALRSASSANGRNGDSSDPSGGFSTGLSKRDKRSSVADRTALWNSQMQALYKNVEGSQKFLPHSSTRHVLQNAGPWIELDNATYKSRRSIQIFLLNDHLLIASRKKRKADVSGDFRGPEMKLVADRCWPLLDIEVVDMAGSGETSSGRNKLAEAIMVRGVGQETLIYRTEKPDGPEKASLLMNIRKAVEELRRGLQSEMDANNKAKDTINYFASRDPGLLQKTALLETLSDIKDMLIEVDGKQHNLRWVESQMDELDIDIALQRFDPAVQRVEKLKGLARGLKNNAIAQDFIEFKVEERTAKLAAIISRELVDSHDSPRKTKRNVAWLTKLGFEDRAREAYLEARSNIIQKRSRQCIFQGDLWVYIWEISFVYFTVIKNTVACFQSCFPPPMMSVCVKWAKEEVDAFNAILARQLSSTDRDGEIWRKCVDQAKSHADMLSEVGLDFRNLVGRVPEPGVTKKAASQAPALGLGLS
ncbi:hypothetical protein PpBr36_02925 [Pyricularia pennisetigena]|uniref:hypothetical protein n=1 Tax=Pyricularia pennisetigena TaxID=1578925 RepID=UPI00114DF239|nr:hypothetical protein PpBr36_02925 [Pyricularia pennisetigena]TLS30432.1 hypothetical protein PpBr36_02925 [Pyricularia pennisetigena]